MTGADAALAHHRGGRAAAEQLRLRDVRNVEDGERLRAGGGGNGEEREREQDDPRLARRLPQRDDQKDQHQPADDDRRGRDDDRRRAVREVLLRLSRLCRHRRKVGRVHRRDRGFGAADVNAGLAETCGTAINTHRTTAALEHIDRMDDSS
jgi:hypothetical protein